MRVLPASNSLVLRWTLVALAFACLFAAFRYLQSAIAGQPLYGVFALIFWAPLAIGLWLLNPAARLIALATLWLIVFILPLGLINPFAAIDDPNPPPVLELVVFRVAPWVVLALFAIHVLGKYKSEFRWRRGAAA